MSDYIKRSDVLNILHGSTFWSDLASKIQTLPSADVVECSEVEILEAKAYAKGIDSERKRILKAWGNPENVVNHAKTVGGYAEPYCNDEDTRGDNNEAD